MASFSYSVLSTEDKDGEFRDRGSVSTHDILQDFDEFDWSSEIAIANERQDFSPTFAIYNIGNEREFRVAGYGEPCEIRFAGEYIFDVDEPRRFGLGTSRNRVGYVTEEKQTDSARKLLQLFLADDHVGLMREFAAEESGGIIVRIMQVFYGLLGFLLGGLTSLTSAAMIIGMLISPETRANNLLFVALIAIVLAPPITIASARLLLGKPNKYGGVFSPNALRAFAVVHGLIGLTILVLAFREKNYMGVLGALAEVYKHLGVDRERFVAFVESGLDRHPEYDDLYFTVAGYLSPKWGGSAEDVEAFAQASVERTKASGGHAIYARIYWAAGRQGKKYLFESPHAKWDDMFKGMDAVLERYPSQWNINHFANFSCWQYGQSRNSPPLNRATIKRYLEMIEEPIVERAWGNRPMNYQICRLWFGLEPSPNIPMPEPIN